MAAGDVHVADLLDAVQHEMDCVVHGHYVYKSVWSPVTEQLILKKVPANPHNEFAVPVIGASQIVSRIPKNYSQITCGILLYTQRGSVICHITGRRRKGKVLEVLCKCIYYYKSTKTQHLFKTRHLFLL